MSFFESIRRANADFYTQNPIEFLTDAQLTGFAQQQGMTIEELKAYVTTSHVEMTGSLFDHASILFRTGDTATRNPTNMSPGLGHPSARRMSFGNVPL